MDIDKAFQELIEKEELNIEAAFVEEFGLYERKMTDGEKEEREEIVKKLKPKLQSFKDRYGDDAKKVMYATATKQAMEEVDDHAKVMAKKGDSAKAIKKMHPEITDDELENLLDEKKSATGYELYHKTFSDAMQHAYAHAKSKGFVVDPKEIDDKVATGPKKPSSGKTNRYSLKAGRKKVEIQVANLDNKRYELNMYIEGVELDERYYFNIGRGVYYMSPDSHKIDHKKEVKDGYPNAKEVLSSTKQASDYVAKKNNIKEEVELDESAMLQAKMALGDAKIKHKEHRGKIIVNKKDKKKAMDVLLKSFAKKGNPPELTIASGSFQEDVDRAKDDSIEGPAKGVKHKCPTHVKRETKEGYEYGRNVSHTISENVVDFINIIWLDSNKLQEMVPVNEVEIISEGPHSMKNHREKFKATTKIAEAYARLPKMDKEKYQKRDGLEGPIMTASGKVLYFDPKYTGEDGRKGTYYDPDTDFYIDQKMFKAYDDTSKLKFYKSPFDDPDSREWKKLQRDRERFEKSLLKGATKRSKKDRLKIESTGLKFARKFYQKGEQDDGSEE